MAKLSSTQARSRAVKGAIDDVLAKPYANPKKSGNLKNCRAKVFRLDGVQHRVLYELDDENRVALIWCVAPREGVYGIAKHRVQ